MKHGLVLLSVGLLVACGGGVEEVPPVEKPAVEPSGNETTTITELSRQASELSMGMAKTEVLALLDQPSWAVTSLDVVAGSRIMTANRRSSRNDFLLTLIWKNGNCSPVMVNFDSAGNVTGWDEGRALCLDEEYTLLPEDEFACPRPACEP